MTFSPSTLAAPAIRIAAAGLGAALGGPVGLALGAALGSAFGEALGKEAVETLTEIAKGFGDESAKKLCELGGDSLAERLKPSAPELNTLYRKALHQSLQNIEPYAPPGSSSWFENWRTCLDSRDKLDLDLLPPDRLTPDNLDTILPRTLLRLDMQGSRNPVPRNDLSPELISCIAEHLPIEFPPIFNALIVKEEYAEAWKQAELAFRDVSLVLLRSIKQDTSLLPGLLPGIDAKLDTLIARLESQLREGPTRKPNNLRFATLGPLFKGREGDIDDLEKQLEQTGAAAIVQPASITGMGGIGKTRLAIEYAWRRQSDFSALLFVSANTPQDLASNFSLLSGPDVLDLPAYRSGKQPEQYAAVLHWLQANKSWLLIFDNADTKPAVAAVQELIPKIPGGQILITSRIAHWGGSVRALGLDLLSEDAAVSYLLEKTSSESSASRQRQKDDDEQARALSQDLGRLALALEQAAAYIDARGISIAEYRRRWQQNNAKLIEFHDEQAMQYSKTAAVTFLTSFDQLTPNGRRLLNFLAWLAPEPIPRSLLEAEGGPFAAENENGLPEEDWPNALEEAEEALADLIRFSLASWTDNKTAFSVHRLLQAVARRDQTGEDQHRCVAAALRCVNAGFSGNPQDVRDWPVLEPLASHALAVVAEAHRREIGHPTGRLMNHLGLFLRSRAEWSQAEPLFHRALAIDEKSYGPNHPNVVTALSNLAQLLQDTNRFDEAEPLMRRALTIDEQSYGPDHPRAAIHLSNLAALLHATNRLDDAEPLMRRVLTIGEKSYGPDHPNVAAALNNLAELLKDTNRLAEAEPLFGRALDILERNLGPDHPNVATALNNLAQLLNDTNRFAQAEPLMRRALAIDEKSLGPDHPNVARDLNNLARLFQDTNRLAEAEPAMRRALAIDEKSFGPDHPDVAIDLNNLAQLLQATNRLDEAEPLMHRALTVDENSYGPGHPNVATRLNNLAQLLKNTSRLDKAEPLMRRALAIDEKSLGPNHPNVARDLNNLAQLLQATNRLEEAEPLIRRALAIDEKSYGPGHPNVARDLNNLARLLQDTNRLDHAEPLMRRALAIWENSFGAEHPNVAIALNNLALLLQATNRLAEAEPLCRRAMAIDEKSLGPDHPNVARDLNNLASLLKETNRLAEAEPLMRRHLEIFLKFTRTTGHPHPHLQAAIANYAGLLAQMGMTQDQILARLRELAPDLSFE